jgi:lycopene cyclase domain-containing protein
LIIAVPFILWDEFFTQNHVWGFNERYLVGFNIGHLPIEEVSFFIVVPFACTFIYECVRYYFRNYNFKTFNVVVLFLLVVYGMFLVLQNSTGWYTISAVGLALFVIIYVFQKRKKYRFVPLAFLITLIPFLVVNGVLTGYGIEDQVVWYNEGHFSTLRIVTIPMEDVLYGFSLIVLNILVFDALRVKFARNES